MRSYAQNFEDVILARALCQVRNGTYIDVGAFHPIIDSVSKAFAIDGWKGLHVEPVTEYVELLRADRPNDLVLEAVVSDTKGTVSFYEVHDTGLSTLSLELAESYKERFNVTVRTVEALTIDDLLELCSEDEIHWLKIDVEGSENSVMRGWKYSLRRPWILVVESTRPGTQIHSYTVWQKSLSEKGYKYVYSDGVNRFYLHKSKIELKTYFRYPPNVFDGFQLTENSRHVISLLDSFRDRISVLEAQQSDHTAETDREIEARLHRAYDELLSKQFDALSREQALRIEAVERERVASQSALAREAALEERIGSLQILSDQARSEEVSRERAYRQGAEERERSVLESASAREAALLERTGALHMLVDHIRAEAVSREQALQRDVAERERATSLSAFAREAALEGRVASLQSLLDQVRSEAAYREQMIRREASERECAASKAASARGEALEYRLGLLEGLLDQARSEAVSLEAKFRTDSIAQERAASARDAILEDRIRSLQLLLDQVRSDAQSNEKALKQESAAREETLREERDALMSRVNTSEKRRLELQKERDDDSNRRTTALARDSHKLNQLKTDLTSLVSNLATLCAALTDRPPSGSRRYVIDGAKSGEGADDQLSRSAARDAQDAADGSIADKNMCRIAAIEARDRWRTSNRPGRLISVREARAGMAANSIDNIVDLLALPADEFVACAYSVLLGRSPTEAESAMQMGLLRAGCGRPTFLLDVGTSIEASAHRDRELNEGSDDQFIAKVYLAYLKRTPDRPGLEHHLESLTKGQSRANWSRSIAGSKEAREVRSFRFELDQMIRNKLRNRGFLGWIGRSRRNRALRHLEFEVIRRLEDRYTTNVNSFQHAEREQLPAPDRPNHQAIALMDRSSTRTTLSTEGSELERPARRALLRFYDAKQ